MTRQLLTGRRGNNEGPTISWPTTDTTYQATYLADMHERLITEQEEEAAGAGEEESDQQTTINDGKKRRRKTLTHTVDSSHMANLLQYEIERQKELVSLV